MRRTACLFTLLAGFGLSLGFAQQGSTIKVEKTTETKVEGKTTVKTEEGAPVTKRPVYLGR